jgi:hypothetical protein
MLWLSKRTGRYRHVIATRVDLDRYLVPAMHRALLIEEIVARIATEADRKTAWALAQACRAFTEPALDAVWAIATYPGVLAGLMSEDLWTIKRPPEGSGNNYPPLCSLVRCCYRSCTTRTLNSTAEVRGRRRCHTHSRFRGSLCISR